MLTELHLRMSLKDLKIGPLERIPPDSIYSNTANVRRVR
jgi:hypothetical protein